MARNVPDLALFLDTMAGFCPQDPLTFDAPAVSFSAAVASPVAPKRVAFTADFGGRCRARPRDPRDLHQGGAPLRGAGLHRRGSLARLRPGRRGVPWRCAASSSWSTASCSSSSTATSSSPTSSGTPSAASSRPPAELAWAERERAALFRRMVEFFQTYDLLVTPGAPTPAFDVNLRAPADHRRQEARQLHGAARRSTPAITVTGMSRDGRPVRLRPVRPPGRPATRRQAARRGGASAGRRRCSSSCSASTSSCRSTPSRGPCRPPAEPEET